ncbi:MAG: choice-of-anchor D domain-containing protein, partial [Acidobacteriia bacterium]|nr:choice-of-anchor D domain-containing protein [Terriglobia bacterium]
DFVSQMNPAGTGLLFSTYLGGSGLDFGQAIALDTSGKPYLAGATLSTNFPAIAGAYQGYLTGVAGVAFVAKIDPTTNAPGVAIVPQKVDFGNQTEGVRSALKTVTVIDAGTAPLTITGIASSSTDFTETDNCVGTIAATGGTCTINIAFTPSVLSAESESITLTDSAGNTYTITVTGTGVTEATAVTLSPTSLTFANQNVGSVSAAQTVTITNTGSAALTITQIATSGDFTQTNTCGATLNVLNVGQSCTVSVIFTPTASGARTGSLTVSDNAVGSPQAAALTGTGLAVFSLSSTSPTTTALIGSTGATFTVSTSAPQGFTGSISFSCSSNATCAFSPSPVFPGQSTTLTMSDLSTSTPNPLNFTVNGISGSQTATLSLTVLFADFSLSATPPLNNIISGDPADYTVLVTPANGFNQQVNLSCSNLPIAATCSFASGSVTPNGSPANVGLRINTVKYITSRAPWWRPRGPGSRPLLPWVVCWGLLSMLLALARRRGIQGGNLPPVLVSSRLIFLSLLLSLLALVGSCRSPSAATGGTIPGNYTITITGTLNSNTSVTRSFTVNLSVNAPVT